MKVDVRVIAATRRDLDRAVAAGRFRDDLFHRLAVARIELPPLREREGDVPLLARQFATDMGGSPDEVEAEIESRFSDYDWPGNVRELRNAVARYIALGDDDWEAPRSTSSSVAAGSPPRRLARRVRQARGSLPHRTSPDARGVRASLHRASAGRARWQRIAGRACVRSGAAVLPPGQGAPSAQALRGAYRHCTLYCFTPSEPTV